MAGGNRAWTSFTGALPDETALRRRPLCYLPWFIMGLGVLPRLTQFLSGRALWHDESLVLANVVERGYWGLLAPLDYLQVAPPLYLWAVKASIAVGGYTVQAARFPSFLASVLALWLGWEVARRLLSPTGALLALALLTMSQHLILYAGEAKPYASDATLTLLVFCLALRWEECDGAWRKVLWPSVLLALTVWYSYPAVFAIAAVGTVQLVRAVLRRDKAAFLQLATIYGASAASFLIQYAFVIVPNRAQPELMEFMQSYWRHGFMPMPPWSLHELRWFRERVFLFFDMPGGFTLHGLALFVFLAGMVSVGFRNRYHAACLVLPIVVTLAASAVHAYPFRARTTLFLAPVIMLAVGEGIAWAVSGKQGRTRLAVGAILFVLLAAQPLVRAARATVSPTRHHELDRAMEYVAEHWQPGERIFMRRIDQLSYRFLRGRYAIPDDAFVFQPMAEDDKRIAPPVEEDLRALGDTGGAVWFPVTYEHEYNIDAELGALDAIGTREEQADFRGASAYRYSVSMRP